MIKVVWKYELEFEATTTVSIPRDGEILSLQMKDGKPCIWVLVDEYARKEGRKFISCYTGENINIEFQDKGKDEKEQCRKYIGTVQEGNLVYHFFEEL